MPRETVHSINLGRSHPLVAMIRRLRRPGGRDRGSAPLLVEGVRLAGEALKEEAPIREVIVSARLERDDRGHDLLLELAARGLKIHQASDTLMDSLQDSRTHQGILLLVDRPERRLDDLIPPEAERTLVTVACGVQMPGNVGALIRLTDAAGGSGMIAVGGADPFGPKAVRASAGSIFRLPVLRAPGPAEGGAMLRSLHASGFALAAASPHRGEDFRRAELPGRVALVLGAEAGGLPPAVEEQIGAWLQIPIHPRVESLNVAAAAAILLFEISGRAGLTSPRGSAPGPSRKARRDPGARASRSSRRTSRRGTSGRSGE